MNKIKKKLIIIKQTSAEVEASTTTLADYLDMVTKDHPEVEVTSVSVVGFDQLEDYLKAEVKSVMDKHPFFFIIDASLKDQTDAIMALFTKYDPSVDAQPDPDVETDLIGMIKEIEAAAVTVLQSNQTYLVNHKGQQYLYVKDVFFANIKTSINNEDPVPEWAKTIFNDGTTEVITVYGCSHYDNEETDVILRRIFQKLVKTGTNFETFNEIQHHRTITSRNLKHMEVVILHSTEHPGNYNSVIEHLRTKHALASINVHALSFHSDKADVRACFHKVHNNNSLTDLVFDDSVDKSSPIVKQYTDLFLEMSQ